MKTSVFALTALLGAASAQAAPLFADDFSTFAPGNLVGQAGWTQLGSVSALPLQVANGRVQVPGGQTANNQDAIKTVTAVNSGTFYAGVTAAITAAPDSTVNNGNGSSYLIALRDTTGNFDNGRLVARQVDATSYVLGIRTTGQASTSFVFGTTPLPYGVDQQIVLEWTFVDGTTNDVLNLIVNPTSTDRSAQTVYATSTNLGTDPTVLGGLVIAQFVNSTTPNPAGSLGRAGIADNFADAYAVVVPEPASLSLVAAAGLLALRRRRA
jgi:hypothetical protein